MRSALDSLLSPHVAEPEAVPTFDGDGGCWLAGSGFSRYSTSLANAVCPQATLTSIEFPRASAIAELAELKMNNGQLAVTPEQATVTYVRNKVANKPGH